MITVLVLSGIWAAVVVTCAAVAWACGPADFRIEGDDE